MVDRNDCVMRWTVLYLSITHHKHTALTVSALRMFPESLDKGQQIMNHAFLHLVLGCTSYSSFVLLPCADKGTQNLMIIRYMEIVLYCGKIIDDNYLISPGTWSTATQPSSCELICTWTFVYICILLHPSTMDVYGCITWMKDSHGSQPNSHGWRLQFTIYIDYPHNGYLKSSRAKTELNAVAIPR